MDSQEEESPCELEAERRITEPASTVRVPLDGAEPRGDPEVSEELEERRRLCVFIILEMYCMSGLFVCSLIRLTVLLHDANLRPNATRRRRQPRTTRSYGRKRRKASSRGISLQRLCNKSRNVEPRLDVTQTVHVSAGTGCRLITRKLLAE